MQSIQKDHAVPLILCQRHVEVEERWLEGAGGGGGGVGLGCGCGGGCGCANKQTKKDPRRLQKEVRIDRTLERSTGEGHAHEEVKCPADQRHVGTRSSTNHQGADVPLAPYWLLLILIGFRANNREQFHVSPPQSGTGAWTTLPCLSLGGQKATQWKWGLAGLLSEALTEELRWRTGMVAYLSLGNGGWSVFFNFFLLLFMWRLRFQMGNLNDNNEPTRTR